MGRKVSKKIAMHGATADDISNSWEFKLLESLKSSKEDSSLEEDKKAQKA